MRAYLTLLFFLSFYCSGQYGTKNRSSKDNFVFSIGASAGQESFIGLPKFGAYYELLHTKRRTRKRDFGFSDYSLYGGLEGSIFVFFAGVFSFGPNVGFKIGPVTFDNTLTWTRISSSDNFNTDFTSYNPKIGFELGPIWLKAGPSIMLSNDTYPLDKWMTFNKTVFNIDLIYLINGRRRS